METKTKFSWELFESTPVIGIIRGLPEKEIRKLAHIYFESGFTTLEVTMNTEAATDLIQLLNSLYPQMNIGAGTVCTHQDLISAIDAGAKFIVTPILNTEVVRESVKLNIPIFPGAYTPTEIYTAHSLGASAVKVFPTNQLGPSYMKNILAPLDQLRLIPTGGVSLENIQDYFEAGAIGVGMGSSLFPDHFVKDNDEKGLRGHLKRIKMKLTGN